MLPSLFQAPGSVLNIAHRGFSSKFPENTMAAFRGAMELKADMIELDVQLSKDNVPVVFHDSTLNHYSNGKGRVSEFSIQELQALDAGSWFSAAYAGERIPALEDVLQLARGKIGLNIEIKTEAVRDEVEQGVAWQCLQLVNKFNMEEQVLFSSFDGRAVRHLKMLNPEIPVAILYSKKLGSTREPSALVREYKADAFNCSYRQLTDKWLHDIKSHQIPIFIYTVDQSARMQKLIKKGVNGIFTNHPERLKAIVNKINQK